MTPDEAEKEARRLVEASQQAGDPVGSFLSLARNIAAALTRIQAAAYEDAAQIAALSGDLQPAGASAAKRAADNIRARAKEVTHGD